MKKKITFYELLTMMKNGTAPKTIHFNGNKWLYHGRDYIYSPNNNDVNHYLSSEVIDMMLDEMISFYNITYDDNSLLTEKEKAYLSAVLKPYKDRVKNIVLYGSLLDGYVYLTVCITSKAKDYVDSMQFPYFEKGTMYVGMEIEKNYTPSELGLWEEE